MHRVRLRSITQAATLLLVTALLAGCGDYQGPTGGGVVGGTRASDQIGEPSLLEGLFDDYQPSSALSDTSISETVPAGYGAVPGSSALAAESASLELDDDVFSSSQYSNLSIDDPTLTDMSLGIDSLSADPTFDSATLDAAQRYGGDAAGAIEVGLDDPSFDAGMDDAMLNDPMLGY